ncbi:MAG: DUF739 family protein [Bacilli bacterium]|nr:DUF739 family protein [Bacilli bacterium]
MFDYTKLKERITKYFKCDVNFAIKMGISERTLSLKLNNKVDFSQKQVLKACELLEIPLNEVNVYFFTLKVR